MKKILFLITLVGALCAPAHAQQSGDWETGQQVQIKCVRGHVGCTLTHENDGQGGGIQDLGGSGTTGTDIDQLGGGNPPTTGGNTGNPPANTGDGDPVITPPDNGGETDAERLARVERERIEAANRRIEQARGTGDEDELRRATQELTRAQNKMQIEMDRKLAGVRRAATGSSAKLSKAIADLKAWQQEMVKAGFTKEVAQWYVTNKPEIEQLLIAFGNEEKPGPLRWLAANQEAVESMKDDYDQLRTYYKEWTDKDGNSYEPLMATVVRLNQEAARNGSQDKEIEKLWNSVGSEMWVKVLTVASFVGVIVLILLKILKK